MATRKIDICGIEKEIIEQLADLEHQQWSHWEKYRENRILELGGHPNMDKVSAQKQNWKRLRETDYKDLTEKEKESDREWARKVLPIIEQTRKETAEEVFKEVDELLEKEVHWDMDTWDTFIPNLKELRRKFE